MDFDITDPTPNLKIAPLRRNRPLRVGECEPSCCGGQSMGNGKNLHDYEGPAVMYVDALGGWATH